MTDKDEIKKKVMEDEDYIRSPKFTNSLKKFLAKNDDGVESSVIARLLAMPEEEVEKIYQEAVESLRREMVGEESD